jgi:hypothetical protein
MKGTILTCVQRLVESRAGKPAWEKVLQSAGCPGAMFVPSADVPDATAMKVIGAVGPVTGMSTQKVMDSFGDYWANEYASDMYAAHFARARTAMEFLLDMDALHEKVTRTVANARPPRFKYESKTDKSFEMVYDSARGLPDLIPGLVKGVARRYQTTVTVDKLGTNRFRVTFP